MAIGDRYQSASTAGNSPCPNDYAIMEQVLQVAARRTDDAGDARQSRCRDRTWVYRPPTGDRVLEAGLHVMDRRVGRPRRRAERAVVPDRRRFRRAAGAALDAGLIVTAPDAATLSEADAIFGRVRTPITATRDPDLAPVIAAAKFIRDHIRPGQLYRAAIDDLPRHDDRVVPRDRRAEWPCCRTGLRPAYAPAASLPQVPRRTCLGWLARHTATGTRRAAALLSNINDRVVEMSSPDAAELAKLLENVFRNINIAFVNQLALLCERMDLDVWEVIGSGGDQAVRVHEVHPRSRRRRALASRSTRTTYPRVPGSSTSSIGRSRPPPISISPCRGTSWIWLRKRSMIAASP